MAGVSTEQGSNKLDVDLNLVPFIDLLSTLVLFLLLTVVWVQIGAIPTSVDSKGVSSISSDDQSKLVVTLNKQHILLAWPTKWSKQKLPTSVPNLAQLSLIIKKVLTSNESPTVTVAGDESVEYGEVIAAIDTLKDSGIKQVGLSTD